MFVTIKYSNNVYINQVCLWCMCQSCSFTIHVSIKYVYDVWFNQECHYVCFNQLLCDVYLNQVCLQFIFQLNIYNVSCKQVHLQSISWSSVFTMTFAIKYVYDSFSKQTCIRCMCHIMYLSITTLSAITEIIDRRENLFLPASNLIEWH